MKGKRDIVVQSFKCQLYTNIMSDVRLYSFFPMSKKNTKKEPDFDVIMGHLERENGVYLLVLFLKCCLP